jgi:hypothetical protein
MRLIDRAASAVQQQAELAWAFRIPLLVAAGAATGSVAFAASTWIAATAGSLAGFTTTTAVQRGLSLRRMLARFTANSV